MSMVFCQGCGKQIHESAITCPHCGAPQRGAVRPRETALSEVSFGQAISIGFSKYAMFTGRSNRPEYWWFSLFCWLISIAIAIAESVGVPGGGVASGIWALATLIPLLSAATRRLHDTGRSGWWQLLYFTIIGTIFVLVWLCGAGDRNENRYGAPV